jgi:hypothetical protein
MIDHERGDIVFAVDPATEAVVIARRICDQVEILDTHYPRRLYDPPVWVGGEWIYHLAPSCWD